MYTQCPKCLTYFQVSADHLKVAQGNVRCGQCRNVFSALGNLTELPPQHGSQEQNSGKATANAGTDSAKSSQQSNLSDAIAAIQALNQSSEKLHLLSESKPRYTHPLGGDSTIKHEATSAGNNSIARKFLHPDPMDSHENIPELNSEEMPEEFNDFNFDEALKAVDEIGIDNDAISAPDDSPIHYGTEDDEDITPDIDGSYLVEDYASSPQEPYIDQTKETSQPVIKSIQQPAHETIEDTVEQTDITDTAARAEKNEKTTDESLEETIKKITLPDLELPEKPAFSPEKNKISSPTAAQLKNIPSLPKQLIDDFRQDHPMLISNYRSIITWGMGSLMLMFVFLGQTVYFKHNELGQINQLRPWIAFFCQYTSCELPMQTDIAQFELLGQDIRSHPTTNRALQVSATIINNAPYTQPYPGLQLNFSDINGEKVAVRNFKPSEYVTDDHNAGEGMEPNTPFQIELEIIDPGKKAINFEFDFFSM